MGNSRRSRQLTSDLLLALRLLPLHERFCGLVGFIDEASEEGIVGESDGFAVAFCSFAEFVQPVNDLVHVFHSVPVSQLRMEVSRSRLVS